MDLCVFSLSFSLVSFRVAQKYHWLYLLMQPYRFLLPGFVCISHQFGSHFIHALMSNVYAFKLYVSKIDQKKKQTQGAKFCAKRNAHTQTHKRALCAYRFFFGKILKVEHLWTTRRKIVWIAKHIGHENGNENVLSPK